MVAAPLGIGLGYLLRPKLCILLRVASGLGPLFLYQPVKPSPYPFGVPQQPAHEVPNLALYALGPQVLAVGAVPARPGVVTGAAAVIVEQGTGPRAAGVRPQGVAAHQPHRRMPPESSQKRCAATEGLRAFSWR